MALPLVFSFRSANAKAGESVYFWFPKGVGTPNYGDIPTLPAGWSFFEPANYAGGSAWHRQWAWGIKVGAAATPGVYSIPIGSDSVSVTVVATPAARPITQVPPGQVSRCATQTALNSGSDVELLPGLHRWEKSISVPDGASIISAGAWIVALPSAEYGNRIFVPAGSMTLEGVTLVPDKATNDGALLWFHQYPPPPGIQTVRRCTIKGGNLCQGMGPMLVEHCLFERGCTGQISSGSVWFDNDFLGQTRYGEHSFFSTGAEGVLLISCRWSHTNRGIVMQTGDCRGWMVMDCYFDHVVGGQGNANEVILMEGGTDGLRVPDSTHGMRDNTFVDIWISDCAGPGISLYGSGMHDNLFWNIHLDVECVGISLAALNGGSLGNNIFENIYSTGRLNLVGKVGNASLINFCFVDQVQKPGNGGIWASNLLELNQHYPFYADADARSHGVFTFSGCFFQKLSGQTQIHSLDEKLYTV